MEIGEVMEYLPHRYPFLLIDRVIAMESGVSIRAIKNVTINEPFFTGHFPHYPVMPGVLVIEAMAQAAAVLSYKTRDMKPDANTVAYFAGIDNVRFKRPVVPGDQLVFDITLVKNKGDLWKYSGVATIDGQVAAEADLLCFFKRIA
ncbi:3-hydroxyacyl-ACP dehydratase FabZ [Niveibacterium sp. 24ML]|nr:3-hydroxyacyl-ACP dehydratase FabZ [Niveibacterium sp. 24ML]MCX9156566.1 3-hydroxyacyl-ACP dehydratase FabZ [Niveibacterium sp. 24ML]